MTNTVAPVHYQFVTIPFERARLNSSCYSNINNERRRTRALLVCVQKIRARTLMAARKFRKSNYTSQIHSWIWNYPDGPEVLYR